MTAIETDQTEEKNSTPSTTEGAETDPNGDGGAPADDVTEPSQGENKAPAAADAAGGPDGSTFSLHSLEEIGTLANYLGTIGLLVLAEPIMDKDSKVMVNKNVAMRESIFKNLKSRAREDLPDTFTFFFNKELKQRYKEIIRKKLLVCLEVKHFHIAPLLVKFSDTNYLTLIDRVLDDSRILNWLISLDKEGDPILPHLGEVALVSGAFTDLLCQTAGLDEGRIDAVKTAIIIGIMHDIALEGDAMFLFNDIENAKESEHEKHGKEILEKRFKHLGERVFNVVASHHREEAVHIDGSGALGIDQVVFEAVNFTEFFFSRIRSIYKIKAGKGENPIDHVFFMIGQVIGEGYFHQHLFEIMSRLQERLKSVLKYGEDIGKIEKQCPHKCAVAYPVPRCSQILCRGHKTQCPNYIDEFPIKVLQAAKYITFKDKALPPGTYHKCRMGEELPVPPQDLREG